MAAFLNSNGLINGKIPAGEPCPFGSECECRSENCPQLGSYVHLLGSAYSCGFARAFSLVRGE